jgi:hypothetical protein
MNDMTLFLAQILGPTFLVIGIGILLNSQFYLKAFKSLENEPLSIVVASMGMIAVGVVLMMKHFLWDSLAEVIVSLLGLGTLLKGILLGMFPKMMLNMSKKVLSPTYLTFAGYV